ncbi:MAG: hypothetical protein B7Z06_10020, partial [Flavobacteriales bacterium 32-35-8]
MNNFSIPYKLAIQKKQTIVSKSLLIQMQKQSYSNENTRAFINYKNVNQVTISFYKINHNQTELFRNSFYSKDSLTDVVIKRHKAVATKNYELLNKKDYFQYTTEVVLPQLTTGNYLVYFESDSDTENKKSFAYETINITNLTVLASQKNETEIFQVLDRKTGKPIENVSIQRTNQTIQTDKNGLASYIKEKNQNYYEPILFTTDNDTLLVTKNYMPYYDEYDVKDDETNKGRVEFYLDRAIYRPGQTVYYKGIAFHKKGSTTTIVAKTSFKITVKDVNNNDFKEFEIITNEFGSFSGEFILPKTGLTGNFNIQAEEPDDYEKDAVYNKESDEHPFWDNVDFNFSQINFKVEEYKRPKFEVRFEPITKSYRINQNIHVKGIAKAFSGSNITDAKVTYTITKFTSYFRNFYNNEQKEVIVTSETKTDPSGNFVIEFHAKSVPSATKEQLPIFNYRINATVTDLNGETHSTETIVKVGYHDLILSASIPNQIETKNNNEILLSSTNLNGTFLATKGEIKIYYVRPFLDKFKARIWSKPEIESITDEEFERLFPYENNTKIIADSLIETIVFSKKVDTSTDKKLVLDFISKYKSGEYKVVFSARDAFDNNIESKSNFRLLQSNDKYDQSKLFT